MTGPVLPESMLQRLRVDIESAYEVCRSVQVRNGLAQNTDGTVHHLLGLGDSFTEFLDQLPLYEELRTFFEGNFVLNSYGGVINLKSKPSYVANVHRDLRTFSPGLRLMANMLVMLDDFTLDNGATYLLTGSHKLPSPPPDEDFFARADRAVGQAGSVVVFDSCLWHAAGLNQDGSKRRALTLTFTRPFIKPQLDYPRVLGYERGDSLSPKLRQLVGYNARIPANLDEWYQPPERRMYRPGQG